jgi:hypothetical protein
VNRQWERERRYSNWSLFEDVELALENTDHNHDNKRRGV